MSRERLYRLLYGALRIFHWVAFLIVVELIFYCAGWMLLGIVGMILDGVIAPSYGVKGSDRFFQMLQPIGKVAGVLGGFLFTRYVMGRYYLPRPKGNMSQ